jgi:hypothetical protein
MTSTVATLCGSDFGIFYFAQSAELLTGLPEVGLRVTSRKLVRLIRLDGKINLATTVWGAQQ